MNPIRKQLIENNPFPFDLVYQNTKQPEHELPDHFHDGYELVYVYKGLGRFFIGSTFYDMREGDLFLLPPNTIHRAFPDEREPVTSTALFFGPLLMKWAGDDAYSPIRCFEIARKKSIYKMELAGAVRSQVEELLGRMHHERVHQSFGYSQAIVIHLLHLLLCLNRHSFTSDPSLGEAFALMPKWMKEILPYIDQHLTGPIGLSHLSTKASVSPPHFSRVFKQWTGMNVTDFILSKRIVMAKEQLVTTDENIEVIASHCGFESTSYFYKTFKRITGITPTEYKKKYRV
ncbi:helix-turn-helix domain-containing protein [Marinicrinis lubricantis]|uniref:Helix-turn-helix domain-containing protein n=1 Tax=Marinicrinis lubricantis TaxID=2086470 RepID=A0ABW1IQ31_9BACL